jgi:hypothetical protein
MSHPQAADAVWNDDLRELNSWIEEVYSLQPRRVTSTPIARAILRRDDAGAVAMIRAYVVKLELLDREHSAHEFMHSLADQLLKRELPFSEDDLIWFSERAARTEHFWEWPLAGMITAMERYVTSHGLSDRLAHAVDGMRENVEKRGTHKAERDLIERLNRLAGHSEVTFAVDAGELWARQLQLDVAAMNSAGRDAWTGLLAHAQKCTGTKPSPEWIEEGARRIDAVGRDEFVARTAAWFALFGRIRTDDLPVELTAEAAHDPEIKEMWRCEVSVPNGLLLKGLIWACRACADARQKPVLMSLMRECLEKTPFGKRFPEGATACRRVLEIVG